MQTSKHEEGREYSFFLRGPKRPFLFVVSCLGVRQKYSRHISRCVSLIGTLCPQPYRDVLGKTGFLRRTQLPTVTIFFLGKMGFLRRTQIPTATIFLLLGLSQRLGVFLRVRWLFCIGILGSYCSIICGWEKLVSQGRPFGDSSRV